MKHTMATNPEKFRWRRRWGLRRRWWGLPNAGL